MTRQSAQPIQSIVKRPATAAQLANMSLIGISPLLSPDLLRALASMGHGDEIVIGDANFPSGKTNGETYYNTRLYL